MLRHISYRVDWWIAQGPRTAEVFTHSGSVIYGPMQRGLMLEDLQKALEAAPPGE